MAQTALKVLTVAEKLVEKGYFKTFVSLLRETGIYDMLNDINSGPYTILAPNDYDFFNLPQETFDKLMNDKAYLKKVMLNHIIQGELLAHDMLYKRSVRNMAGNDLYFDTANGLSVNDVRIIEQDIICDNGVLQVLGSVLTRV